MANVLGELFSDIAQSIRSGLGGYNGTMKPVEFAGKIDEIVALLNAELESRPSMDGMASTSNLKIVSGDFRPEADRTRITIEHGLGVIPDIIMVYQSGPPVGYDTVEEFVGAYPILSAWGVKSSVNVTTRSGMNLPGYGFATAYGIDDMPEEERAGGYIYCPDEDTFQVGRQATDGAVGLAANLDYYWIAISGIGSGAAEPVVQALTVTENGTYTPPEGVDGYSSVTVNVDPTKLTILRDQKLDGFAPDDNLGYILIDPAEPFTLTEGEEYSVSWDGTTYTSTAQKADTYLGTIVYIGNGTLLGLPGNNEPFAIGCANGMVMYLAFTDPAASHTVGIWQAMMKKPKLQEKEITENGEYTADEGFDGLGKVLVNVAGSGGGSMVMEAGTFTGNGAGVTVEHSLGCVPLVAWLNCTNSVTGGSEIIMAAGISREAATITGKTSNFVRGQSYHNTAQRGINITSSSPIDEKYSSNTQWIIYDATETSITFGGSYYITQNGHTYEYFLIGSKKE